MSAMSAFTPPPPLMTTRNGIQGSFVKAVQAFEQFELDPKVVLLVGLAVDRVQDLLTAFGTAAVDDSEDFGCVFGDRLASSSAIFYCRIKTFEFDASVSSSETPVDSS